MADPHDNTQLEYGLLRRLAHSTSYRLLAILIVALLPLALLATYAAQQVSENAADDRTRLIADTIEESADRLNSSISNDMSVIMSYADRIALGEDATLICPLAQRRFTGLSGPTGALIYAGIGNDSGPICELGSITPGFRQIMTTAFSVDTMLLPDNNGLLVQQPGRNTFTRIIAYYPPENLLKIADPVDQLPMSELILSDEKEQLHLTTLPEKLKRNLDGAISAENGVAGLNLGLNIARPKATPPEFLNLAIPFVMMIAAALIGWWVVNRMVMRPMSQLRRKMTRYSIGDELKPLQRQPLDAAEIQDLDNVFLNLTRSVADDKQEIDRSLKQQVALTREVHHRVKNNLQIVASLISLHARTAETPTAAHAYASIQRRVEALSVVHRNHHADGEQNRGIDLRSLINEILNSFRTADDSCDFTRNAQVSVENASVSQDTAMPVAFLLTEILELLQISRSCQEIHIGLGAADDNGKATLTITSRALKQNPEFDALMADGIDRVIMGLSRQLRSELVRDEEAGTMEIDIPVM
ncbi:sensor histidine kinase [Sphingorhabdus sp. Alg239-R122]|uniref:sensor histidine kinase n=1 Tax=Sphingorhabdus sp. Alg239-R122 TaxID=2305989 RepID=UPI0013DB68B6|nr:sensor histidine kinase [Sphingorhabdus sp. Alg239-R122]